MDYVGRQYRRDAALHAGRVWGVRVLAGIAFLLLICALMGASQAHAYNWKREVVLYEPVEIFITEVSRAEMRATIAKYGKRGGIARQGFSVLGKTADDDWVCLVFVRSINNQAAIEHEEMHCQGWTHE